WRDGGFSSWWNLCKKVTFGDEKWGGSYSRAEGLWRV
ncbi:hypothetical protein SOVF_134320, partial [Spinacia oleracea]